MHDLKKLPYAEWLEHSLSSIIGMPVESICILTKFKDGGIGTGYYECSMMDKIMFGGYLQQEAMMDSLINNGYIDDGEEDENDDYVEEE